MGLMFGGVFAFMLIAVDLLLRETRLRTFNTMALGLFFGYLFATALLQVTHSIFSLLSYSLPVRIMDVVDISVYLFAAYFGVLLTLRADEGIYVSIPFTRFKPTVQKRKDLLFDTSILADPRIIDFAVSGLLDMQIIIPRFVMKDLQELCDRGDESAKAKARRSLEVIKKLEGISSINLVFSDTDFPELKDPMDKFVRLARLLDANILTADINRIQMSSTEGVRIINIHSLSNALKPIAQAGEYISIKVQRYGKEAKQGVGYLDDGTMVVINGGGDFIGETIKAQVLSVKHTSSGRMVFCNALDAKLPEHEGGHSDYKDIDEENSIYQH
ncbi:Uncharacterized PIN and TRAM-domain containing protein YacL [Chlamydiales bacterium SCGC AG-110-M15]|nr:Uncharacterized PIN and TRAM-domain containing protein YacL [Chlamydiales bacterium SCGC AG-110-M15]